jgi:apolipoprotein D and lipocalin family protein
MNARCVVYFGRSKIMKKSGLVLVAGLFLSGCVGVPKGIEPVTGFELPRYLGTWYEIARLDHSFERGLDHVSAEYSMRLDGGVRVMNRGERGGEEQLAEGRAYFVGDSDVGYLKVAFFGPFFGSYILFDLDQEQYQAAYVAGPNRNYLWFLSRTPTVSQPEINRFVSKAAELGFATDELIFPDQKR